MTKSQARHLRRTARPAARATQAAASRESWRGTTHGTAGHDYMVSSNGVSEKCSEMTQVRARQLLNAIGEAQGGGTALATKLRLVEKLLSAAGNTINGVSMVQVAF